MKSSRFPDWVSDQVIDFYAEQGITSLFDWQRELLDSAADEQNLVFSAPTSAGKSIVAELLGWKVASTGKKVLFVLPYISVAREKLHQIQKCWRREDLAVCGFIGPQASNPNEWVGAVCTIEKAASLTNRALSEEWFHEIGMIVVDELHMVFDSSRGAHIEHMLSKVLLWNKNSECKVKIVGMSATIPELKRIGEWLDARVFEGSFRPINLTNHIVIGKEMKKLSEDLQIQEKTFEFQEDPLVSLAEESFKQNVQTLIMISSKMEAEKTAVNIAMKLHSLKKTDESIISILKERSDGLLFTKNGLERHGCKDRNLIGALAWGVAFHHAGLTVEERECIESAFREKAVIILVATSTLASGVNLPAERVLIKAQTRGPSALTSLNYRQMVGRAGRTGHATRGESFLIVKKCDLEAVKKIISCPLHKNVQTRQRESERTNLSRFILEGISTGLTTTKEQILHLCSLLLFDSAHLDRCDVAIDTLFLNSFISFENENEQFQPTQLGRAAIASSLPPEASLAIFKDLNLASQAIALDTELHMLYLVTPINVSVWQECDWHHLFALFTKLPPDHRRIAKLVGASERFILEQMSGRKDDLQLQVHTRFFSALALFDLINEMSIYEVSQKYRITRGCLQTLQSQSATYAAMIVAFCLRLGWTYLKALLDGFAMRLLFGIRLELSELVQIEGIDGQRARILHEKGVTCLSHLSACDSSKLAHYLTLAVPYSSSNTNDGLGEWLFGEPRMRLEEAARLLKERARKVLMRRIQELGITVDFPKVHEEEKQADSCDSGLPESCPMDEMTKSVTEMSLVESECNFEKGVKCEEEDAETTKVVAQNIFPGLEVKIEVKMEEEEDDEEDSIIECLETSLLKLKAPKDERFLRRLSQAFSPAGRRQSILNESIIEDSFDMPVPGCVPLSFRTPKREIKVENDSICEEDSFDRPVPGSIPISAFKPKRQSILNESRRDSTSSIASDNKSFDVFLSPPVKKAISTKRSLKHARIECLIESPLSAFVSSPVLKHAKMDSSKLWLEDVCYNESAWKHWLKSITSTSSCSISLTTSGVAVHTEGCTTFVPLVEEFDGVISNDFHFSTLGKCVIPLSTRLECLKHLVQSVEVHIMSMEVAYELFDKFGIRISRPKIVRVVAHLSHQIDCEASCSKDIFADLLKLCDSWNFDIHTIYGRAKNEHKTAVEAFAMSRVFENLKGLSIRGSSHESVNLELTSCHTVLNMFFDGIRFDDVTCHHLIRKIRSQIEELEESIWRLAHGKFNLDSVNEVSNVLFHRLGLVYPETSSCKSKGKHLPTNKLVLEQMIGQHAVVGKIIEYRHVQHTLTQCLLPLAKFEGRIHCWFEVVTSTGRILTSYPNIQNVTKKVSLDGSSARQLFTASSGFVLIGADYKQLELRVLAHFSNDHKLLTLISEGRDLFEELSQEWRFPRDAVKQLCYGLIYGMGAKSLAELTKVKVEEAENMLKSFFAMFPGVRSFINSTKERADKDEYVETLMGRKKIMKLSSIGEERARLERVAVNFTIQGTASEIFKTAIVEMDERIRAYSSRIVLTVHDEVLVECPANYVEIVSIIISDCMQNSLSHLLRVPMRVSLKTGSSWAELK